MPLFIKSLDKNIDLFCNRQNFNFNKSDTQTDNDANFSLINFFAPTSNAPSITGFDFVNPEFKGFRFEQELSSTGTFGDFSLKTHDLFGTSNNIFKYTESTNELTFYKKVNFTSDTEIGITSVGLTGGTGISVSGSPITESGTINLQLSTALQYFSSFAGTGFVSRNSSGNYLGRSLVAGTGISITNANGISGNPVITATGSTFSLSGDITGSGSGSIATSLSATINRTSDQNFLFPSNTTTKRFGKGNFDLMND